MADVAKKRRFCAIELGQRLGALARILVRRGVADGLREARREQVVEPVVRNAATEQRAEAQNQVAERTAAAGALERLDQGAAAAVRPVSELEVAWLGVDRQQSEGPDGGLRVEPYRRGCVLRARLEIGGAGEARELVFFVEQIEQRERNVVSKARHVERRVRASVLLGTRLVGFRKRVQEAQPSLFDHFLGRLHHGAEDAAHAA